MDTAYRTPGAAPTPPGPGAAAAAETHDTSFLEPLELTFASMRRLATNYALLGVLDARRAAMQFAWLIGAGILVCVLVVTAWLAAVVALSVWLFGQGLSWPAVLLWAALLAGLALTFVKSAKASSLRRGFDVTLLLVSGSVGLIILVMWFFTEHTVTSDNFNLLWAWPLHVAAAVLVARGPFRTRERTALAAYMSLAAVFTAAVLALWTVWPQWLHPAVLPWMLLLVTRLTARSIHLWRRPSIRGSKRVRRGRPSGTVEQQEKSLRIK